MVRIAKKILVVNKDFQYKYTWNVVLIGILTTVLSVAIILIPLYIFGILRIPRFLPTPILLTMGFAAIINIVVVILLTVASTHKIAGPVFALNRALRNIELGKWNKPLKLRDSDEMKYLATNFNTMVEALVTTTRQDIECLDVIIRKLEASVEELSDDQKEIFDGLKIFKQRLEQRIDDKDVIGTSI